MRWLLFVWLALAAGGGVGVGAIAGAFLDDESAVSPFLQAATPSIATDRARKVRVRMVLIKKSFEIEWARL